MCLDEHCMNIHFTVQCLAIEDDPFDSNFPSISLNWPESDITATHSLPYPCLVFTGQDGSQKVVTRRCGENTTSGAKWEPVDFSQCNFTVTKSLDITLQLCEVMHVSMQLRCVCKCCLAVVIIPSSHLELLHTVSVK